MQRRIQAPTRGLLAALLAFSAIAVAGCSSVMPRKQQVTVSVFETFEATRIAFDKVVPGQTSATDLKRIGFDPQTTPNIRQVSYLQIVQAFLPNQGMPYAAIPESVRTCIAAQTRCTGYVIDPKVTNEKRVGSVALDMLNFRRKTVTTGWAANALLVLLDGVVVYKIWAGEPNIDASSTSINPLGPLQNLGGILERVIPPPNP